MDDFDAELTPERRDEIIDKVAEQIVKRGLETPAILFLEMNKPVSFIASQGMVALSPFVAPFVGFDKVRLASRLFESRDNVELLERRIEDLAAARRAKPSADPAQPDANP